MKTKGFTLVELLAVICILGVLVAIAVPSVMKVSERLRNNMYCTKIDMIEKAAEMYGQDNKIKTDTTISVQMLLDGDYLKPDETAGGVEKIIDPRNKTTLMNEETVNVYLKYNRVYADFINDATDEDGNKICD